MRTRGRRDRPDIRNTQLGSKISIQAHFKAVCTMQHSLLNRLPCISVDKLTHKVASNNRCHYLRRYVRAVLGSLLFNCNLLQLHVTGPK